MSVVGGLMIAGLAAQGISTAANAVNNRQAQRRLDQSIRKEKQDAKDFYESELNKDAFDRSENKSVMKRLREKMSEDNKKSEATAAITGASTAKVNAAKQANNRTVADVMTGIAERSSAQKDRLKSMYRGEKQNILNMERQNTIAKRDAKNATWNAVTSNIGNLTSAAMKADANGAFENGLFGKNTPKSK